MTLTPAREYGICRVKNYQADATDAWRAFILFIEAENTTICRKET